MGISEIFAQQLFTIKYQDHRDYCTQKQKHSWNVAIQNINIPPPQFIVLYFFLQRLVLKINRTHNTVALVKRKRRGSDEQLLHLHTFKPAASGVRQILNFREPCRKLHVHNNNTVTWWLFQPSWACIVLQGCYIGDGGALPAVQDRDLAWNTPVTRSSVLQRDTSQLMPIREGSR